MKHLIKPFAIACITVLLFKNNVNAQTTPVKQFRMAVEVEFGPTTGVITNTNNFAGGGNLKLQYGLSVNTAIVFTAGFYNLFGKDGVTNYYTSPTPSPDPFPNYGTGAILGHVESDAIGVIPVKVGLKQFLKSDFYLSAETGIAFETKATQHTGGSLYKDTKFLLSPGIGYANKYFDLGARYERSIGNGHNYGFIGVRIAVAINPK